MADTVTIEPASTDEPRCLETSATLRARSVSPGSAFASSREAYTRWAAEAL